MNRGWSPSYAMRAIVQELSTARVKVFNPEHSFVVSGVGRRQLSRYISQLPGVEFKPKRGEFTFRDLTFSFDDGGDMGGDGLWIRTNDGLPHPDELRMIREHVERMIEKRPHSKKREIMFWVVLAGAFLVCAAVCFATLSTLTALPVWGAAVISVPSGAGLFYIACKWAEM